MSNDRRRLHRPAGFPSKRHTSLQIRRWHCQAWRGLEGNRRCGYMPVARADECVGVVARASLHPFRAVGDEAVTALGAAAATLRDAAPKAALRSGQEHFRDGYRAYRNSTCAVFRQGSGAEPSPLLRCHPPVQLKYAPASRGAQQYLIRLERFGRPSRRSPVQAAEE